MLSDTEKASHLGFLTVIDHPKSGFHGGLLLVNSVGRPMEFHCTGSVKPNRAQEILFGNSLEPYLFGEQIAQTLIRRLQDFPLCVFTDSIAVLAVQRFVELPILYVPPKIEKRSHPLVLQSSQIAQILQNKPQQKADDAEPSETPEYAETFENTENTNIGEFDEIKKTGQTEQEEQKRLNENTPESSFPDTIATKTEASHEFQLLMNIPGFNVDNWMKIEIAEYPLWFSDTHEQIMEAIREKLCDCSKSIDFAEPFLRIRLALDEAQKAA